MERTDLSRYDNSWYSTGGNVLKRILWYYTNVIFFKSGWNLFVGFKVWLLRLFGAKVGQGVMIKPCVNIKYPWNLTIGDYAWIGEDTWIDSLVKVQIGANSCLSQGVLLLCGNHNYKKSTFDLIVKDIKLEDGCWVGARSIVTGGVTMHSHAVLCANSVATKDLDAYWVYQGNPAVKVRERLIEQ